MATVVETENAETGFIFKVKSMLGDQRPGYCYRCAKCTSGCPVAKLQPEYRPHQIVSMVQLGLAKELFAVSDLVWSCALCLKCKEVCPQDVAPVDVLLALRNIGVTRARSAPEFVVKFFDKKYERLSFEELCKAPVSAISGISESDAANLKKAFGIDTVEELAKNKYVLLAQGINSFSKYSGKILDKEFESNEFEELRKKPVSVISGISEDDATLLKKALGINTIQELAESKYVMIAQLVTPLVSLAKILVARAVPQEFHKVMISSIARSGYYQPIQMVRSRDRKYFDRERLALPSIPKPKDTKAFAATIEKILKRH